MDNYKNTISITYPRKNSREILDNIQKTYGGKYKLPATGKKLIIGLNSKMFQFVNKGENFLFEIFEKK